MENSKVSKEMKLNYASRFLKRVRLGELGALLSVAAGCGVVLLIGEWVGAARLTTVAYTIGLIVLFSLSGFIAWRLRDPEARNRLNIAWEASRKARSAGLGNNPTEDVVNRDESEQGD